MRGNNFIDMTGKKFGRLTVKEIGSKNRHGSYLWVCKCDCGNITSIQGSLLRNGHTKSCGCLRKKLDLKRKIDMTGQRIGSLTVIKQDQKKKTCNGSIYWLCSCECGNTTSVRGTALRRNMINSCGCLRKKAANTKKVDMVGRRIGLLTILKEDGKSNGKSYWLCQCDCGKQKRIRGTDLRNGNTKSCGCLRAKKEPEGSNINQSRHRVRVALKRYLI